MTHPRRLGLGVLAWVIGIAACSAFEEHACTEIGCSDGATLTLRAADDSSRVYNVTLLFDGREVRCGVPDPESQGPCSDAAVSVEQREGLDCEERRDGNGVSRTCLPNGKFEQVVHLGGTPSRIDVTAIGPDDISHARSFALDYAVVSPNGPACEPQCRQAEVVWVVE